MSDIQLEKITKMIDPNANVGIKNVTPTEEDPSSFNIGLNNGHSLNEFLPTGIKFLIDKKDPEGYSPMKNTIDFNPELLNNSNYRAILAHECGHSLVKNPKKSRLAYL